MLGGFWHCYGDFGSLIGRPTYIISYLNSLSFPPLILKPREHNNIVFSINDLSQTNLISSRIREGKENSTFHQFECVPKWLVSSCERLGFVNPTLTQMISVPKIFDGKDVILQAQTGSGKTLCYAVPILSKVDPSRAAIQVVVVVPTRELGLQVSSVLKQLASESPEKIMIMSVVEGSKNRRQMLWATAEPPHIVVGNPKSLQRIVDLGRLRLNSVSYVVLDEVDACLIKPETRQELHRLLSRRLSSTFNSVELENAEAPVKESTVFRSLAKTHRDSSISKDQYRINRQTIMCSATIPQRQHFSYSCFKNGWTETVPELIHVSSSELMPIQIKHEYVPCKQELKLNCLQYLIKKEIMIMVENNPNENILNNNIDFQALVFIDDVNAIISYQSSLQTMLNDIIDNFTIKSFNGTVDFLIESMAIEDRSDALDKFRLGYTTILLCSDFAARGLDIPATTHVIQLSLPKNMDDYLHRSGRTGRNGREGKVITITNEEEDFVIQRFSNELNIEIRKRSLRKK
eukprot:gene6058-8340_t